MCEEQYAKDIKTTSIEKQTGGETTTIQVADTDSQSIEDMVDESLLQTEDSNALAYLISIQAQQIHLNGCQR